MVSNKKNVINNLICLN